MITTFIATLLLPVAAAVGIGVALSLILQLNREALDLRVVELLPTPDGQRRERKSPSVLMSRTVTMLDVYGSLLYAGSRTLQVRLPDPAHAQPVGVSGCAAATSLGRRSSRSSTTTALRLADIGSRLYLSGVDPAMIERYRNSYAHDTRGDIQVFEATEVVGESTLLRPRQTPAPGR